MVNTVLLLSSLYLLYKDELGLSDTAMGKANKVSDEHKWAMISQHNKLEVTLVSWTVLIC